LVGSPADPRRSSSEHAMTDHATSTQRGLNIIGLSAGYHDASCCLLRGGSLVAAAQEERFSRVKNDKSLPRQSFRYCLQEGGLTIADVDCVAFYEDPTLKLGRQVWMGLGAEAPDARRQAIVEHLARPRPEALIRRTFGFDGPLEIVEHHLSHAASAFFYSGWEEAAILTVDGVGDWATTAYASGKGSTIERFEQVDFPHSLGFFYSAITAYLGFEVNEGEYKVMGLAPYGRPIYADHIARLIVPGADGQYSLDLRFFSFLDEDSMFSEELVALLGQPSRAPESELTQFHMDVARSVQVVLEEVLLEKVKYLHRRMPSEHLCMAGGVALNVVANSRCLREGPFERLFVQPAAGDAGGALGAAAIAHVRLTGEAPTRAPLSHVFLGPPNPPETVRRMMRASSADVEDFTGDEARLIERTVDYLASGKIVGWCQGRMEFGPRALGARSILADPRVSDMRDRINALVKHREAFRPFAPAVLASDARAHFDLDHASPFMLEVCQVVSPIALPAITHVDGSARVQTVDPATSARFAALIAAFYRRTGCPVLLNTSFNMRGEPIVNSALDAINCFIKSGIDLLVLEDFLIDRAQTPLLWQLETRRPRVLHEDGAVGHLIYTLL
jgi:carbamoyltransferase